MQNDNNRIYLPVENISVNELYDWARPNEKTKVTVCNIPQKVNYKRQNSKTGSMVKCNEQQIALFRYHEKVYAMQEKCPHLGGPLHLGDIEEMPDQSLCVKCPWHSWKFDLETGRLKVPRRTDIAAAVFPVKVSREGKILIGFDQFHPSYFSDGNNF